MNPNEDLMLAQLERELRSLQPLPPDPTLVSRLERALHDPIMDRAPTAQNIVPFTLPKASPASAGHNQVSWKPWAAVAACAAVATGAVTWKHNQLAALEAGVTAFKPASRTNFIPKGVETQFQNVSQGALVVDPHRGLMRQLRVEFNNQQEFIDVNTGSVMRIVQPVVQEILVSEPVQ